jgi:hypothetical protein
VDEALRASGEIRQFRLTQAELAPTTSDGLAQRRCAAGIRLVVVCALLNHPICTIVHGEAI